MIAGEKVSPVRRVEPADQEMARHQTPAKRPGRAELSGGIHGLLNHSFRRLQVGLDRCMQGIERRPVETRQGLLHAIEPEGQGFPVLRGGRHAIFLRPATPGQIRKRLFRVEAGSSGNRADKRFKFGRLRPGNSGAVAGIVDRCTRHHGEQLLEEHLGELEIAVGIDGPAEIARYLRRQSLHVGAAAPIVVFGHVVEGVPRMMLRRIFRSKIDPHQNHRPEAEGEGRPRSHVGDCRAGQRQCRMSAGKHPGSCRPRTEEQISAFEKRPYPRIDRIAADQPDTAEIVILGGFGDQCERGVVILQLALKIRPDPIRQKSPQGGSGTKNRRLPAHLPQPVDRAVERGTASHHQRDGAGIVSFQMIRHDTPAVPAQILRRVAVHHDLVFDKTGGRGEKTAALFDQGADRRVQRGVQVRVEITAVDQSSVLSS